MKNTKHKKMKKITLATIKSFIRKNEGNLFVNVEMDFNGMTDCVEAVNGGFSPAKYDGRNMAQTMGICGVWFVGRSNDYFQRFEDERFIGFEVYNSCGTWKIAVEK